MTWLKKQQPRIAVFQAFEAWADLCSSHGQTFKILSLLNVFRLQAVIFNFSTDDVYLWQHEAIALQGHNTCIGIVGFKSC